MLCSILRELATQQRDIQGSHQNDAGIIYGGFNDWIRISPSVATPRLLVNTLFRDLFDALIFLPNDNSARQIAVQKLPDDQRNHAISRKLISSFNYMRKWVHARIDAGTPTDTTNFLIASHDVLRYLFYCIETLIFDEEYSYEVFGCLNTRGESLTHADNIKNELFKVADTSLHQQISSIWNQIGENVPDQNIGEFLRRRHIALFSSCKKQETYSQIKDKEIDKFKTKRLITDWHQDSKIVHRILQREANIADKETRQRLEYIFDVLNISLAYIPILSAAKSFLPLNKNNFQECVRVVECFVFRYLTIGQIDTTELERKLGEASRILADGGSVADFRAYLQKHNTDLRFETDFASHIERRTSVQYYILRELEKYLLGSGKGVVPGDHHKARNHIEHILPKRLSTDKGRSQEWKWARDDYDKHRSLVNRIGNLLILEKDINLSVSNHEFSVKQCGKYKKSKSGNINHIKCYKDSALPSAKDLCVKNNWPKWTKDQIERRQKKMAKDALEIWRI